MTSSSPRPSSDPTLTFFANNHHHHHPLPPVCDRPSLDRRVASTGKRGHDATDEDTSHDSTHRKRRRTDLSALVQSPYSDTIDFSRRHDSSSPAAFSVARLAPIASPGSRERPPLFFSDRRHIGRPPLPPRFSSGEAGEIMLSKAQADEANNLKTVKLARGNFAEITPPGPGFLNFGTRSTSDKSSILQNVESPNELSERADQIRLLSQIGIAELLEQDSRPTFIIDLSDSQYQTLHALQIIFANQALRTVTELLHVVQAVGNGSEQDFLDFQEWCMNPKSERDSPDLIPAFSFSNITWRRSTLRGRIRLVSAVSDAGTSKKTSSHSSSSSNGSKSSQMLVIRENQSPKPKRPERSDYFGDVVGNSSRSAGDRRKAKAIPTHVGIVQPPNATTPTHMRNISEDQNAPEEVGFFDWTRLPLTSDMPRHIRFARSVEWSSTALGPIEYWPPDLRQICNLIMASPHPSAMYWGPDLVAIYNEAYVMLAGQKHPVLMGARYRDAWAEIWEEVKDAFASAMQTGQATMKDDDRLFLKRSNYMEETFFSWSIIPLVGGDGSVCGLLNPAFERTQTKIAERRMLTLREVGERTAVARDIKGFWKEVLLSFQSNEWDTPFVLLYSVSEDNDSDGSSSIYSSSMSSTRQCYLEGTLGVPDDHPCAPKQIDLRTGPDGFGPFFREAVMNTTKDGNVLLRVTGLPSDGSSPSNDSVAINDPEDLTITSTLTIPYTMLEGIKWRGFGDPCRSIVVCPVHTTPGDNVIGFVVLGVNPRRPYDQDYALFTQLLIRQCATSLASVVLFEEEIKRGQKAAHQAALDKIELSEQLAARTQEARDIEGRFTHMAEYSPAGLFIANSEGRIAYCNNRWYEISGVPKDRADDWIDYVEQSDQEKVRRRWARLVEDAQPVNFEFRFKKKWEDSNGNSSDTWVLFSAHPEKTDEVEGARLRSVFGNITDISTQKWVQKFQAKKTEEAVELKRQQEEFVDITSHEMRNPLSAVLMCADQISASLSDMTFKNDASDREIVLSSIDAAETIVECAQHQKRIVDDILTLSKLESDMLVVAPVDVQPKGLLQRALRMFQSEAEKADIDLKLTIDESYTSLNVDWARLDPQRVGQVIINLMTNALKFTNAQERKGSIEVGLAASRICPSALPKPRVQYFPARNPTDPQLMTGEEWGSGEPFYIEYSVKDTGPGLTENERSMLFNKFTQASHRTHVHYGGSGLGLFISRQLTELQGGEIGVSSVAGKGSTFAFYIQSRMSTRPENPNIGIPANLAFDSKHRRANKSAVPAARTKRDRRISLLVVEDNLVNQRVLQKQLQNLGYLVHVANHGGEALDILRRTSYWKRGLNESASSFEIDAVLMDQEMPVMDGVQCTKQIREWENTGSLVSHVPIIGITANARQEQINDLLGAGMDDVVAKPFRMPELLPKVEELSKRYPNTTS